MKKLITILIMCFCCSILGAQTAGDKNKTSTTVAEPRFEVITLFNVNGPPYMLDKYEGKVWMKYYGVWNEMTIEGRSSIVPNQINFQLILDQLGGGVHLLNVHTGEMWFKENRESTKFKKVKFN